MCAVNPATGERRVINIDDDGAWGWHVGGLPDLTDPATLGCLLALVREAWGKAVSFRPRPCGLCGVVVTVGDIGHGDAEVRFSELTFAAALVAALEAAP